MRNPIAATFALLALGGAVTLASPAWAGAQAFGANDEQSSPDRRRTAADDDIPVTELQRGAQEVDGNDGYRVADRSQRGPAAHVWLDSDRDLFSPGALTRVYVRTSQDAYVSVIHITPDGDVEFLWPRDVNDDGYLEGGRSYALSTRGGSRYVRLGYGYGIGYVFAVTSDEPLDMRRFRDFYYRRTSGWNSDLNVVGDPFHAMERFARDLVPGYDEGYGSLDWYSYHVGSSRYRYPRYACYDSYGPWYSSRSPYWDSCDRVRVLLVRVPFYYDTRYYRGDRSVYWRNWYANDYRTFYARRREPQHGYKEGVYSSRNGTSPNSRPLTRGNSPPPAREGTSRYGGGNNYGGGADDGQNPRASQPSRTRPTLQRRPTETEPVRVSPRSEPRSSDAGDSEPRERGRESRPEPRSEPRVREAPQERPREAAPRSAEPRRESPPPSRSGGSSGGGGGGRSSGSSPRVRP